MKYIKLHAYLSRNLGDDLMIKVLTSKYPHVRFYCEYDRDPDYFNTCQNIISKAQLRIKHGRINHICNIITAYRWKSWYMRKVFRSYEKKTMASIYIGGSLFMEPSQEEIPEKISTDMRKLDSKPFYVVGANFGPYQTQEFLEAYKTYFSKISYVTFRDQSSYDLFSYLDNTAYAQDIVFNLDVSSYLSRNTQTGKILISVIDCEKRNQTALWSGEYERFIVQICIEAIHKGKTPVLMSFCQEEGDEDAINRIIDSLPSRTAECIETYFYQGDIEESLRTISDCEKVIATRFHAMILAFLLEKPCYSIAYNCKISNVLDDIGNRNYSLISELSKVDLEHVLSDEIPTQDTKKLISSAKDQFAAFEKYVSAEYTKK